MEQLVEMCVCIDVGKAEVVVCVWLTGSGDWSAHRVGGQLRDLDARRALGGRCAMDIVTGEARQRRLGTDPGRSGTGSLSWKGPSRSPTRPGRRGSGPARELRAHGIVCLVAAPSNISRAPW